MSAKRMNRATRRGIGRRGWSLIEVVMAVGIMGGALLGFAEFGRRFAHSNGINSVQSQAIDLAVSRVERVKFERTYATIDTCITTAQTVPGTTFTMQTQVTRTNNTQFDYRTVTVTVANPRLPSAVVKTTAIAAF